ncbi:MAG: hypothetical protein DMG30_22375 [Acidobacteria bacterium]|nr:MAG: hypothetical protein DMG30_22375 [Acidobacteriota bacterium]
MIRSKPRSPQERRWLKVLGTLNEFQARLFLASLARLYYVQEMIAALIIFSVLFVGASMVVLIIFLLL